VTPGRNRRLHAALGAVVAAAFVWWFFQGVNLTAAMQEIREARVFYLAAAVAMSLAGFGHRIARWRYLVAPFKWVRMRSLAAAVFMGWTVSAILPGRVGEIARAVVLGRREGLRASALLGTIVLERLLDAFAIVLLLALSLTAGRTGALESSQASLLSSIRTGALITSGALAGIAAALLIAHRLRDRIKPALRTLAEGLPGGLGRRGWSILESFGSGISGALKDLPTTETPVRLRTWVAVHTIILWLMICGVHFLLLQAFRIEASVFRIPPLLFLITLGLSVPVPAGVGSYHKAVQLGLTGMLGVSSETATGYAIVSHAVTLGPPALIGALLLAREGLSLPAVTRMDS
jgi:glycosyltransferase 2 family protein